MDAATPYMNLRPTLLLAEDSSDDAYFFERALKRSQMDCDLVHVSDGSAAVDALRKAQETGEGLPDLIFLDLKMPVMNGFEVLEWIQGQQFPSAPEVIVLSGSDHDADQRRARALGASDYLVKPITVDLLTKRLQNVKAADKRQPANP